MRDETWSGSGTAYWANVAVPLATRVATDRVLARVRRNIAEDLPLEAYADVRRTCAELGIPFEESGPRALQSLEAA